MTSHPPDRPDRTSFSLRLGNWLEAQATGWGVVAIPIVVLLLLVAAGFRAEV